MSATVDSITAQTASTTLNDTTPAPAEKPAAENEAVIASAAEGRRLYIGNLAYATTEGELKEFFKEFLVESTSIPTNPRTNRPVGYAFVDLSTPSEAERAISELNGKAILERKVSIQLARKPEAHTEGAEGTNGTKARKDSKKEKPRRSKSAAAKDGAAPTETAPTNVPGQVAPALTQTTNEALTSQDGAEGTTTVNPKAAKTPVPRKQRGPPEDGVPSKTKVMVANLPYDLTEEKLKEIFIDYQPSSAKIALRPIPRFMVKKLQARNEPRKGRGFGFVTLASEELQQKACAEMNGKEIEGREIAVKVAIDSPGKEDDPEASIEATGEEAPSTAEASGSVEAPTATA